MLGVDRVDAVQAQLPCGPGAVARLTEADRVQRSQAHFPGAPVEHEAVEPTLGAIPADVQPQPTAVAVDARRADRPDLDGR